jgi:hypothetical protein
MVAYWPGIGPSNFRPPNIEGLSSLVFSFRSASGTIHSTPTSLRFPCFPSS